MTSAYQEIKRYQSVVFVSKNSIERLNLDGKNRLILLVETEFEEIVEKLVITYKLQVKQEEISALLMRLCLMGKIKQDSSSWFSKK